MREVLKKKWHRIPVALVVVLLILALVTGGALAAYGFLGGQINLTVTEPMTVEYDWPGDSEGWLPLVDNFEIPISGYAGDSETFGLRVCNAASGDLTIATVLGGNTGRITVVGMPDGLISGESCWEGTITASINGDAPPGSYTVTVDFTRE